MVIADFARAKEITSLSSFDSSEGARLAAEADSQLRVDSGTYFYTSAAESVIEDHSGGVAELWLRHRPIVAISSIQTLSVSGTVSSTLQASTYYIVPEISLVKRRQGSSRSQSSVVFPDGEGNLRVTYTHGTPSSHHSYPVAVIAATALLCAKMLEYTSNVEAVKQGGAISYSLEISSENFGREGPYYQQIQRYMDQYKKCLRSISNRWRMLM